MKIKSLLLLCASILTLASCGGNPTPSDGDDDKPGGEEKVEPSVTEIVFGDVFKDATDNIILTSLTTPVSVDGVTISFKRNTGSADPTYNKSKKEARIYRYNSMTISKEGLSRIDFVFGTENGTFTVVKGTYVAGGTTTGKWTGEYADSLEFTVETGQRRVISMTVYTGEYEDEEKVNYPEDTANSYTVDIEHLGLTNSLAEAQSNFKELMMGYFGKQRAELSDLSATGKVQLFHKSETYNNKVYEILALQVGSAENSGSLTLNFSKNLKRVKFYSSPNYAFERDEQTGEFSPKCDSDCTISVNGENWNLGSLESENFEVKRFEKEFTINSNALTISGTANHRVFTYAMTFTF